MLDMFFKPSAIAIIGASAKPLTIGYRIMKNLQDFGFGGPIHPVSPSTPEILGRPAFKNVTEVPGPVDLAHIVIKNTMVPDAIRDCAKKGIKGVIVIHGVDYNGNGKYDFKSAGKSERDPHASHRGDRPSAVWGAAQPLSQ